ncbi:Panacea domain-containing protein [Mycobacterium sp. PDNC021]|uniref:Panacea domain-containing protein n=1 Tax=Mycobacterium sp. PDNC021 TaxID=3391399 RepID=UPI003AAA6EDC
MANVHDVAAYILQKKTRMSAMKLQKLVYYSKAWHLVWEDKPLFREPIQAWANGPVVYELYDLHRGKFEVTAKVLKGGDPNNLTTDEKESIDVVLKHYGHLKAYELSDMTHREDPWRNARGGLPAGAPCSNVITDVSMYEYYLGLVGSN